MTGAPRGTRHVRVKLSARLDDCHITSMLEWARCQTHLIGNGWFVSASAGVEADIQHSYCGALKELLRRHR